MFGHVSFRSDGFMTSGSVAAGATPESKSPGRAARLTCSTAQLILPAMRARPIIRLQASMLVALIMALTSGVPSHHHGEAGRDPILVDAGHHGHAVQLVDQTDRITSDLVVLALPVAPNEELADLAFVMAVPVVTPPEPIARGRPPPSDLPRAPPVSV